MDDLKQDTLDTKRVPNEALSAAGLAAPYGSAVPLIKKQIARLKTHRQAWSISGGNLASLPSDGQMQIIISDLERAVSILNWPKCCYCNNPERGGNRQGSHLCDSCYNDGPARP
jgi:hypothetical protein